MSKVIRISRYEQLSDEELIAEVTQRRREIQQPKLDFYDNLLNFLVSTTAVGFGIASTFGYLFNLKKPAEKGFNENLREMFKSKTESKKDYLKANPKFAKILGYSSAIFALVSLISMPIGRFLQKSERSEDNATKYMFGKDELFRRGYMQTKAGDFVKTSTSQEVRAEQQKLMHRVEELEKGGNFTQREAARAIALEEESPLLH